MSKVEAESNLELPECPVCLQHYGDVSTIPRVLSCGHSACQDCLPQLHNPFPCTVRCPSCNQLVKLPNPISHLPKNIDLLRFSTLPHNTSNTPSNHVGDSFFIMPPMWSHDFYSSWKPWVLSENSIVIESNSDNDGFLSVCYGKVLKVSNCVSSMGCVLKEAEKVSLLEIGSYTHLSMASSKFEKSYEVKIMSVLYGLSEGERNELEQIIKASLGIHVMSKVYGFWYNMDNHCVYLVSEAFSESLLGKMSVLTNAILEKDAELKVSDVVWFMIVGLDICQVVNDLHLRGLPLGYLGLSCFGFDKFGHVYGDISELLATGRRVRKTLTAIVVDKEGAHSEDSVFVSPEVLLELLKLDGSVIDLGTLRHCVEYGSDIWSLACVIISLLFGKPFAEEMRGYLSYLVTAVRNEKGGDLVRWYTEWRRKIINLTECRMGSEFTYLMEVLSQCLDYNPENRPLVSDLWKTLKVLVIKSKVDEVKDLKQEIQKENMCNCLMLGDLCRSMNKISVQSLRCVDDTCVNREEADRVGKFGDDEDVVEGLSSGQVKCIDLKGHLNCITGLAIGGGFLFSSSFDKMVNVWSLQDYSHVHSFKGHEQRVTAVAFVDNGEPLCISGDNGGVICIWEATTPLSPEPLKKLQEQQDWRYSGIHALAVSRSQYLYTGSGDKSIKAWSLQDYSLSCTMNGHKSVVSSLAICDKVLYSGSWDGTVRLWCLSDHSPLAVLGEETPPSAVSCLAADEHVLVAAHENGMTKIWFDDNLVKSEQEHNGAILSACKKEKWIFTGGWDKNIKVKEVCRNDTIPVGCITCDSVVTALVYWKGKLFVGQADGYIKVYCS